MNRFARSLSSEMRKVTATKTWWVLGLVLLGYSAMMGATFAFLMDSMASGMGGAVADPAATPVAPEVPDNLAHMVYATVTTFGYVVPLVFGALIATGELRHRTLALTFLAEPRRGVVLGSKTVVLLLVGAVLGVLGLVGAVAAGASVLVATDHDTTLSNASTWLLLARIVAGIAMWAVIGFGVGLVVRNQVFAVVLALVFTQFLEPVLRMAAQVWEWSAQIAKYLPGAATDAFVGASVMNDLAAADPTLPESAAPLEVGAGFLVLAAYCVVMVLLGWRFSWRRDIVAG